MRNRFAVFTVLCTLGLLRVPAAGAQTTALFVDSQPGDWVGAGKRQTWTGSDLPFKPRSISTTASQVEIEAGTFGGGSTWWDLIFASADGTVLAPGVYDYAGDVPFRSPLRPGLNIGTSGRGCDVTGRFVIYEIAFDSQGQLVRFAADFEQHCENQIPGLFGAIRFNAARSSLNPFDGAYPDYALAIDPPVNGSVSAAGIACGGGADDCQQTYATAGEVIVSATPAPGHVFVGWTGDCEGSAATRVLVKMRETCGAVFDDAPSASGPLADDLRAASLFFFSRRGDYIGGGVRQVWTRRDSRFQPQQAFGSPSRALFSIDSRDGSWWTVEFAAPVGQVLAPGDYVNATRYPFQDPPEPGLDVSGHGRGCNELTGRFRVYEAEFDGEGRATRFAADFEQHCEGFMPPLFGAIRYNSTRASILPFDGEFLPRPDMVLETPLDGSTVSPTFAVAGWAMNQGEPSGTGVDAVHVYAFPLPGGAPIFLGVAAYGAPRSDLAAQFGSQFLKSGFSLTTSPALPLGKYVLAAIARDTVTGTFNTFRTALITVALPVSIPAMAIDTPPEGAAVVGAFALNGWAIDFGAFTGSGVDAIHVYAFKSGSNTPMFLGVATLGVARPDLVPIFGPQFGTAGYHLDVSGLAPGSYTLWVGARSTVSGQFTGMLRTITVTSSTAMAIDLPGNGSQVAGAFQINGWALDAAAPSGSGIDAVHVWALPANGAAAVFLGVATLNRSRPDIGAIYGARFSNAGFNLVAAPLAPGAYTIAAVAHSVATGTFNQMKTVTVIVP